MGLFYKAFFGDRVQDGHSIAHFVQECLGNGFVYRDNVFFFVVVARPKNFVHDIAVVKSCIMTTYLMKINTLKKQISFQLKITL